MGTTVVSRLIKGGKIRKKSRQERKKEIDRNPDILEKQLSGTSCFNV